ncbi:MAG: hypothetical protein J7501_09215 [Bdellovibrio sp.]|nr:hypothetical protein [Bdellovibrio sp.]
MRLIGIFTLLLLLTIARVNAATWNCQDVIKKITPASETLINASSCQPESSSDERPLCFTVSKTAKEYMYRSVRFSPLASDMGISVINQAAYDDVKINAFTLVMQNDMISSSGVHWIKKTTLYPGIQFLLVDYYSDSGPFEKLKHMESQSYNCKPVESF